MAAAREYPSGPVRVVSTQGRMPPHDIMAEGSVLSACLYGGAPVVDAMRLLLTPESFYAERHRHIFAACLELADLGIDPDVPAVAALLMDQDRFMQVGGRDYLVDVLNTAPALSMDSARSFARVVAGRSAQRDLLSTLQQAEAELYLGLPTADLQAFTRTLEGAIAAKVDSITRDEWAACVQPVPPEWCVTAPPTRTWLLRDLRTGSGSLPLGKTGMLLAEGGAGKTTLLCQLALAVATGETFVDLFEVTTPGRVLLLMGEEERDDMQRQIHRAAQARNIHLEPDQIIVVPLHGRSCALLERDRDGNVQDTPFAKWLFGYLKSQSFSLVVLDPVSRFAGLEAETDNAQATRYVQTTERIAALCGGTALNSHHTNKTSRGGGAVTTASARGSSAFTDGHRWVATLSIPDAPLEGEVDRLGEVVTLSFTKNNYELRGKPVLLRRTKVGALEPLDDDSVSYVRKVQSGELTRQTRKEQRLADRSERIRERELADAKAREARTEASQAARRSRDALDDHAVTEALRKRPEASQRELVASVKATRGCGTERAHDAVLRILSRTDPGDPAKSDPGFSRTVPTDAPTQDRSSQGSDPGDPARSYDPDQEVDS